MMKPDLPTTVYEAKGIDILKERATGRCDEAGISYYMLLRSIDTNRLRDIPGLIAKILERGAWKKWRWIGSDFTATSIDEYVATPPPRGLGASVELVERLLTDQPEALEAFKRERVSERAQDIEIKDQANLRPAGRPRKMEKLDNNSDDIQGYPSGTSAAAAIRRLRKEGKTSSKVQAIYDRVLAGELSPHAGMIEAGFRKKVVRKKRTGVERAMTATEKQMLALFAHRKVIDRKTDPGFTENHRWLIEATELLLRHQLELVEELRNAGILR